jgi:VanZ family protein
LSAREARHWQIKISFARPVAMLFSSRVRNVRSFMVLWLPVLVWMALIFTASSDQGSFRHSSRILDPLLHWLFPNLSEDQRFNVVFAFRKMAHLTEYAILALLVWRARRHSASPIPRTWTWTRAFEALWVAAFYAATDEFHQTFVPSREGCVRDVCIDTAGAAGGLALLWLFGLWRKWW